MIIPVAFIRTELQAFIRRDSILTAEDFFNKLKSYYEELEQYPSQPMKDLSFEHFESEAKRIYLLHKHIKETYGDLYDLFH